MPCARARIPGTFPGDDTKCRDESGFGGLTATPNNCCGTPKCASGYVARKTGDCDCWFGLGCDTKFTCDGDTSDGQACTTNTQCKSGDCRGGNCCGSKGRSSGCTDCNSDGDCFSCSPSYYKSAYQCFSKKSDGSTCDNDGQCDRGDCHGGRCCGPYQCFIKKPDGSTCIRDVQCNSGDCRGGNCCGDKGQSTGCTDCNPDGECSTCRFSYYRRANQCFSEKHDGASCSFSDECDSPLCRGGNCCGDKGQRTGCTDCNPDGECSTCSSSYFLSDNQCYSKKHDGSTCESNSHCSSGACRGGRCCSSAVGQHCEECQDASGDVRAGACTSCSDGHYLLAGGSGCASQKGAGGSCTGYTECASGNCGDGQCQGSAKGSACSSASECASTICRGGNCCGPKGSAAGCTGCASDGDCSTCDPSSHYKSVHECFPKKGDGSGCSFDAECGSGACRGGSCCGTNGDCVGTQPHGPANGVANATANATTTTAAALAAGAACEQDAECASGDCRGLPACPAGCCPDGQAAPDDARARARRQAAPYCELTVGPTSDATCRGYAAHAADNTLPFAKWQSETLPPGYAESYKAMCSQSQATCEGKDCDQAMQEEGKFMTWCPNDAGGGGGGGTASAQLATMKCALAQGKQNRDMLCSNGNNVEQCKKLDSGIKQMEAKIASLGGTSGGGTAGCPKSLGGYAKQMEANAASAGEGGTGTGGATAGAQASAGPSSTTTGGDRSACSPCDAAASEFCNTASNDSLTKRCFVAALTQVELVAASKATFEAALAKYVDAGCAPESAATACVNLKAEADRAEAAYDASKAAASANKEGATEEEEEEEGDSGGSGATVAVIVGVVVVLVVGLGAVLFSRSSYMQGDDLGVAELVTTNAAYVRPEATAPPPAAATTVTNAAFTGDGAQLADAKAEGEGKGEGNNDTGKIGVDTASAPAAASTPAAAGGDSTAAAAAAKCVTCGAARRNNDMMFCSVCGTEFGQCPRRCGVVAGACRARALCCVSRLLRVHTWRAPYLNVAKHAKSRNPPCITNAPFCV